MKLTVIDIVIENGIMKSRGKTFDVESRETAPKDIEPDVREGEKLISHSEVFLSH